ncbi:MAG: hypothetical protein BWK80_12035 [Desulfobacteraceae bacterium IS3]|nr:MAG: hypothetical protein BWK80_12035 [Desulfobacteraceae bacterium IS3]
MISVQNLIYEYPGHRAIDDISFTIRRGAITALVGPNGAGKTTLLNCLSALSKPFSGKIFINNLDVLKYPRASHKITGFLPDFFGLYDSLTVHQSLSYFAMAHGVKSSLIASRIIEIVENLNLRDKLHERVSGLSRGMRQRLGIAQAMIHDPELLLLDEPASGLDPEARYALSELFLQLNRQGKTLLVSSHILSELDQYATDMLIMRQGKLVESSVKHDESVKRRLCLKLLHIPDQLPDVLKKNEIVRELRIEGDTICFEFGGDETAQHHLLKSLISADISVREFYVKREGVQEQYLEAVKEKDHVQ